MATPSLEELLAQLSRGEVPACGYKALSFTIPPGSGDAARITARMGYKNDPACSMDVPAAVKATIQQKLLPVSCCVDIATLTEEELASFSTDTIYPAGFPMVVLYIYPFGDGASGGADWVYETESPQGITLRDIVRCIAATYRVMYAAEEAAVGKEAHAARAGPHILNRGRTEGPFRIWGHDLRDLVLEGFTWAPNVKGGGGAVLPMIGS